ncbi:MAG: hypothetical protein M3004_10325 [Bacteroidota bacterium]|nr:hypothetical protein [Bacteroidota bacterium]
MPTKATSPALKTMIVNINSAALPKVVFNKAPILVDVDLAMTSCRAYKQQKVVMKNKFTYNSKWKKHKQVTHTNYFFVAQYYFKII